MNQKMEDLFFILAAAFSVAAIIIGVIVIVKHTEIQAGDCVLFDERDDGDWIAKKGVYIKAADSAQWIEVDGVVFSVPINGSFVTECGE